MPPRGRRRGPTPMERTLPQVERKLLCPLFHFEIFNIFGDTNLFIRARHPRLGAPYRAPGAPEGVDPHSTNYIWGYQVNFLFLCTMSKNVISSEILKCQNWGKITPFLGVRGQRGHQRGSTPISREHPRRIWNNFASIHFFVRALFRPLMPRTDWRTDWRTDRITFIFLGGLFQCKDPTADAAGIIVIYSLPV